MKFGLRESRILPIVRALANITPERTNTISEALFKIAISFLIKYCPQKPASTDTAIRYKAVPNDI